MDIKSLQAQGLALIEKQRKLIKDDPRPYSKKAAEVDALGADIKAVLDQHAALKAVDSNGFALLGSTHESQPGRLTGLRAGLAAKGYRPIAAPQLDIEQEQYQELFEAGASNKSFAVSSKAADDSTSVTPAGIPDFRLPPVTQLREPTRVLSLLPTFATQYGSVEWFSTTGTTAAAAVAEGGAKPQSHIAYTPSTTSATKIAHYVSATDESFQDFPTFMGVLQTDMVGGLIKAENDELLNASTGGAHKWNGLLNTSGILTRAKGGDTSLDAISKAFDDLRAGTSFAGPDGIVLNPATWGNIRRLKDSNGRYYLNADPLKEQDLSLWGVPVVLTTQIAAGTALLGAFQEAVAVYVRQGIRLEVANQGDTAFTTNTTLVRAEERFILTVPRPSALVAVTGL